MEWIAFLRWIHVIGACVLLGTGAGIAFFMVMAHRSNDARLIAQTARIVVIADYLFTTSAVIVQPITGFLLAEMIGWRLSEEWLAISLILYAVTGCFWLPVVWMQQKMRKLADEAARKGAPLPAAYHALYKMWFAFGFPAFFSVLAIIWLMTNRPVLNLW